MVVELFFIRERDLQAIENVRKVAYCRDTFYFERSNLIN